MYSSTQCSEIRTVKRDSFIVVDIVAAAVMPNHQCAQHAIAIARDRQRECGRSSTRHVTLTPLTEFNFVHFIQSNVCVIQP